MHWLITSTTYGTWLPGDPRGSITSVRDYRANDPRTGARVEHDQHGEPWEPPIAGLHRSSAQSLRSKAVLLSTRQATAIRDQFLQTALHRGWRLVAASVMANHFHLIVGVSDHVEPTGLLGGFKAWASRALTAQQGAKPSARWFTTGGSTRPLKSERAVETAMNYVLHRQHGVLAAYPDSPHK